MLMKTKTVDFHHVDPNQKDMDAKLINWASWVRPRAPNWVSPMFRQSQSNSRQWHTPEIRQTCDVIGAQAMEKAVFYLPESHRTAIRWHYVFPVSPAKVCRALGVSMDGLAELAAHPNQLESHRPSIQSGLAAIERVLPSLEPMAIGVGMVVCKEKIAGPGIGAQDIHDLLGAKA